MTDYDDSYRSCVRTYSTLLIYPGEIDPVEVTTRLGIEPSSSQRRGQNCASEGRKPQIASLNGWFLTSKGRVESRDSRRHIDWILDQVEPSGDALRGLIGDGARVEITCYWLSRQGDGGPIVSTEEMRRMSGLGIELWFDFYGPFEAADGSGPFIRPDPAWWGDD